MEAIYRTAPIELGLLDRDLRYLRVTERKTAVEALRISEERFRAFMDNSPNYIHMKDADGRTDICL